MVFYTTIKEGAGEGIGARIVVLFRQLFKGKQSERTGIKFVVGLKRNYYVNSKQGFLKLGVIFPLSLLITFVIE